MHEREAVQEPRLPPAVYLPAGWIIGFSFDALFVDFRARPLAKVRMSSDLLLPIKRANSSAVNGRFSSRTRGRPEPKSSLNQRPNRCICNYLHTKPPTNFSGKCSSAKLPPRSVPPGQ